MTSEAAHSRPRCQAPGLGGRARADSMPRSPAFPRRFAAAGPRACIRRGSCWSTSGSRSTTSSISAGTRTTRRCSWPDDYWPPAPAPPSDRRVGRQHQAVPEGPEGASTARRRSEDRSRRANSARHRADVPPRAAAGRGSLRVSCRAAGSRPAPARRVEAAVTVAPTIAVSGLTKIYGATTAVNGLSFDVAPGEIVGLIGANGAGKTSTLRCIVGIQPPTRGPSPSAATTSSAIRSTPNGARVHGRRAASVRVPDRHGAPAARGRIYRVRRPSARGGAARGAASSTARRTRCRRSCRAA